ncbi:hypothetical protein Pmani_013169 [Petrolisthes manimaculis]|uniref:VPS9 domain-containing protein n=1 Tax=Petrolisthes manimaculis TaxID=1843537 RepID=A0AAE1UDW6_9EUCA|nr:hypothetical protein Pmani_013169 [Petrolisthes manimaculis]
MERYDEDLSENSFFQALVKEYVEVFERAVEGRWVICVPRAGALPKYALAQDDILSHILIPSEELPETHYRTLTEKSVVVKGNVLVVENSVANPLSVHILFDETFYDDDLRKYKVLCLEEPLYASHAFSNQGSTGLVTLYSLRDCIDLLWTEAGGEKVLQQLNNLISQFLNTSYQVEEQSLQCLRDLGCQLFTQAVQVVLSDPRLGKKTKCDQYLLDTVKLAVENYVLHGIYKRLMKGIAACKAEEDARLNRAIKNLSDLQVRDLDIDPQLSTNLTKAKFELFNIEGYSTPLGKLCCLKRVIHHVLTKDKVLSSDELLPILVFLIVKTNLPNWFAHLTFLKQFCFSASGNSSGESSFYISSLEAALEHIYSGSLLGSSSPEADSVLQPGCTKSPILKSMEEALSFSGVDPVARFFECIRLGKVEDVKDILDGKYKPFEENLDKESAVAEADVQLCHPLCSCDQCEKLVRSPKLNIPPTVFTREERGYTGLHVACIFGRPTVVDLLVGLGSDLHATDFRSATPLHYAAQRGHQNALLLLLHAGADVNKVDGDMNTPLHLCSLNGHLSCVKAILFYAESVGVELDINAQNNVLDTPLHMASRWGYSGIVELLLDRLTNLGLTLKLPNNRKLTVYECAHNHHIARMILEAKLKKDEEISQGFIRVGLASSRPSSVQTRSLDFENRAESFLGKNVMCRQDVQQMRNIDKMLKAVKVGDVKLACFYLGIEESTSEEEDEVARPPNLCHPLCQCTKCFTQASHGASELYRTPINACNGEGYTALHLATAQHQTRLVRVLLHKGADPNPQTTTSHLTPLHLAAQTCHLELMEALLGHGAQVDLQDNTGNTSLHHCCFKGFDQGVKLLLEWGASRDLTNLSDNTPAQEAENRGHWHLVQIIFGRTKLN